MNFKSGYKNTKNFRYEGVFSNKVTTFTLSNCAIKKFVSMNTFNIISLFLGNLGMTEILIIAFVVLLLFGGKKIPELMRGIGKGVSSFKQGMNDIQDEITKPTGNKDDSPKE